MLLFQREILTKEIMEKSSCTRVMLWTIPRSLSLPFVQRIGNPRPGIPNVQIVINPYSTAHDVGPERVKLPDSVDKETLERWNQLHEDPNDNQDDGTNDIKDTECSYKYAKDLLEQDFVGNNIVLCKDFSYGISDHFDMLPDGYKHSFLIRNPYKTLMSWRNLMQRCFEMSDSFNVISANDLYPVLDGYKKCWDLMQHLQEQGEEIIVVDADDMQQDPGAILHMYYKRIGIDCLESTLDLDDESDVVMTDNWIRGRALQDQYGDHDETCVESPRIPSFQPAPKRHDVPFDILQYIDASMPYYLKMYAMRISS